MTRRTAPEAERSGARKGLQEAIPKEPPGHVRDTHLFILSRPGRAAVPLQVRNRSSGTANPPTLRSPVCGGRGGRFPADGLRSRVGEAAAAASAGGAARISSLPLAQTSRRGTAAGRELSPERPPGCCSAALGRPLPGPAPGSSREAAPGW